MTPQQYAPLIAIGVAVPMILLRNRQARPLTPERLWIMPLVVTAFIAFGLWGMSMSPGVHAPFGPLSWAVLGLGATLGAAFGWQRGRMTTIERRPDGSLAAKASPLGILIIVAVLAGRQAMRPWLEAHAGDWHVSPLAMQDAFLLFAWAMVVTQRVEMFIRARRIQAGGSDPHMQTVTTAQDD
jgi:hypothetical protein